MEEIDVNKKIDEGEYTLFDKFLYGGIGYGHVCLPKNLFTVILSVIYPPFGIIIKHLQLKDTAPYITLDGLHNLINNLGDVIYCVLLTFLFWVPGVIYAFQNLQILNLKKIEKEEKFKNTYGFGTEELTDKLVDDFLNTKAKKNDYNL